MPSATTILGEEASEATLTFYRSVLGALKTARVPFLIGGGFAFSHHTGILRYTKDLDLFLRPVDAEWALAVIAGAGFRSEMIAAHWLGKAYCEDAFIDIVFSSGNGVAVVHDEWLEPAEPGSTFG